MPSSLASFSNRITQELHLRYLLTFSDSKAELGHTQLRDLFFYSLFLVFFKFDTFFFFAFFLSKKRKSEGILYLSYTWKGVKLNT